MEPEQLSLLAALLSANVDCVIVGGFAVIAHGYVRTTTDLDIFIRPTEENAEAVFAALSRLGVPLDGWVATDLFCDTEHLRFVCGRYHVDILSSIGEMHFAQAWSGRVNVNFAGLEVPFISKADLIENKLATGRHRDLADVEELEHIQSPIE